MGFNVKCPRTLQTQAHSNGISVLLETVIYRLAEKVTEQVVALLPKIINSRIVGEASVLQVFRITIKGRQTMPVAGCRIGNGAFSRSSKVRVQRGPNILWQGVSNLMIKVTLECSRCASGQLQQLKQGKTDANSVNKGQECGMSFEGFEDFEAGDTSEFFNDVLMRLN